MSKAVLISIRPKWCELIASGKKTIEIRKTRPKLETPFKCYIYCTKTEKGEPFMLQTWDSHDFTCGKTYRATSGGEIIGEFVCDRIFPIGVEQNGQFSEERGSGYSESYSAEGFQDCLLDDEFDSYLAGKIGYGWHISKLKIYFQPKPLSDYHSCSFCDYRGVCPDGSWCQPLKRPPQSWCYVEELP